METAAVSPELVDGLFFTFGGTANEKQSFDKLRTNGLREEAPYPTHSIRFTSGSWPFNLSCARS